MIVSKVGFIERVLLGLMARGKRGRFESWRVELVWSLLFVGGLIGVHCIKSYYCWKETLFFIFDYEKG